MNNKHYCLNIVNEKNEIIKTFWFDSYKERNAHMLFVRLFN